MDFPWNKRIIIINHPANLGYPHDSGNLQIKKLGSRKKRPYKTVCGCIAVSRNPNYKMLQDIKNGLSLSSQPFFRPAYDPSSLAWNNKEEGHGWPDGGQSRSYPAKLFYFFGGLGWSHPAMAIYQLPVVPHKAVAEVSKIGDL